MPTIASRTAPADADLHRIGHQPARGDRLIHQPQQFRNFKRLDEIIVGARLGGFNGRFRRAVGGHHQDRQARPRGVQFAHEFQAAQAGQLQIGDDDVEEVFFRARQAGVAAVFDGHFVIFAGQHALQNRNDGGIVFNQQNFGG